ncbi:hypothetical protein TIFTF001_013253 [Ficus carica]|uniref:H(+)-transporting two-sector ATPase n=1 Tax=Ficus carica TaxID=3494 RepID=A0AA88AHI9_FICCA|nr:hypothetical protein TIFTF001_013253 [Ficus carica]
MGSLQERITSTKEGSITSIQAVYVPADDLTDPAPATTFAHLDAITVLSRGLAAKGIYLAIDPLDSVDGSSLPSRSEGGSRRCQDGDWGTGCDIGLGFGLIAVLISTPTLFPYYTNILKEMGFSMFLLQYSDGFALPLMWNFTCYSGIPFLPFLLPLPVGLLTVSGRFCPCSL